jgi:hypothetical protein
MIDFILLQASGGSTMNFVMLGLMAVIFYVFIPERLSPARRTILFNARRRESAVSVSTDIRHRLSFGDSQMIH